MKKLVVIVSVFIMLLMLTGCQNVMYDEVDYIERARKEFSISDSETIEMKYIGEHTKRDKALLWFVSGNEYQSHNYLPMSCSITEDGGRIFEDTRSTVERGTDIVVVVDWHGGYAFCVNNTKCKTIRIDDYSGVREIEVTEYPFIYYNTLLPREYTFLDEDGNEIY